MSWHYSQGQEAASWAENSLVGAPDALSKLIPTGATDSSNDNGKVICRRSPFGMTLRRSTGARGMESLTWFQGDSPVRTYLPPAEAKESVAVEADYGPSMPGSLAKFNPGSYGWKTAQCLLDGGLMSFSETFPRWGMMRDGELFPLPTPSGLNLLRAVISRYSTTFGSESGFSQRAPTPKASPSGPDFAKKDSGKQSRSPKSGDSLATAVARVPTPRCEDSQCAGGHRDANDTLYGLICRPKTVRLMTPNKRDWKDGGGDDSRQQAQSEPGCSGEQDADASRILEGREDERSKRERVGLCSESLADTAFRKDNVREPGYMAETQRCGEGTHASVGHGGWWFAEPGLGRVASRVADRVDRLSAIGDGQSPAVVRLAWRMLTT